MEFIEVGEYLEKLYHIVIVESNGEYIQGLPNDHDDMR